MGAPFSAFKNSILANRVAIFIDGAYLDHVMKDEFGGMRLDYAALSKRLAGDSDILRSYYYHCPPFQSNPPTQDERERYATKESSLLHWTACHDIRCGWVDWPGVE